MTYLPRELRLKFDEFSNQSLISIYKDCPDRLRKSLQGLTELELTARPRGEQTWTIYDIVCHLADSESIGYTRVQKVYLQDTTETISNYPRLALYNQDLWAHDAPYHLDFSFLEKKLTLFQVLRDNLSLLFHQFTEDDWTKKGNHLEYGLINLRFLLELYANHGELHLQQILNIRDLLGKPMEMEEVLPVLQ